MLPANGLWAEWVERKRKEKERKKDIARMRTKRWIIKQEKTERIESR